MSVMDETLVQPAWLAAIFQTFGPALHESGQRCFFSLASAQSLSDDTAKAFQDLWAAAGIELLISGRGLFVEVGSLNSSSLQRCMSDFHQPALVVLDGPFQKDRCEALWHDFSQKGYVVRIIVVKLPKQKPWMFVMGALVSQIQLRYEPAQWLLLSCNEFQLNGIFFSETV